MSRVRIVKILGGLGNQMFQYALALSLEDKYPDETILVDTSAFNGYSLHDGYLIDHIFGQRLGSAKKRDILKLNYPFFHYRLWQIGKRLLPKRKNVYVEEADMVYDAGALGRIEQTYYDGYWQSEKYFSGIRHKVLDTFKFPIMDSRNRILVEDMKDKICASIHVRRGDYLKNPLFKGLTDQDYYLRAINALLSKTPVESFIIFSNDMDWCRKNLSELIGDREKVFVDWNSGLDSYRDMQLMTLCSHNIIANSSFSWWGAWLNRHEDKIVIAPKKWINTERNLDIIPESWIKI